MRRIFIVAFSLSLCACAGIDWRRGVGGAVTALDLLCGSYGAIRPAVAPLAAPSAPPAPSALPSGAVLFIPLDGGATALATAGAAP